MGIQVQAISILLLTIYLHESIHETDNLEKECVTK